MANISVVLNLSVHEVLFQKCVWAPNYTTFLLLWYIQETTSQNMKLVCKQCLRHVGQHITPVSGLQWDLVLLVVVGYHITPVSDLQWDLVLLVVVARVLLVLLSTNMFTFFVLVSMQWCYVFDLFFFVLCTVPYVPSLSGMSIF